MMTSRGYFIFAAIILFSLLVCTVVFSEATKEKTKIITFTITGILCVIVFFGMFWFYNNTSIGLRALSQDSQLINNIERTVILYDVNGEEIERFEGRFNITYDTEKILLDDQNSNRYVIYPGAGLVVINEKIDK